MTKNAVTDTHVGATSPGWDHEGFADVRHKLGLNEDVEPRHRSTRKKPKDEPPSWRDYPVGSRVVCATKDDTGYVAWFLGRVIDAYEGPSVGYWHRENWGRVYLAIEATNSEKCDYLVGHIYPMAFGHSDPWSKWSRTSMHVTTWTPAQFREIPRDLKRKAS